MNKLSCCLNEIKINVDEVDFRGFLKPSSYLQYFQDITATHFEQLKLDHMNMQKKNKFWILSRMSVIIDKPIVGSGNDLTVSTFMRKPGRAEAFRDFYLHQNDQLCARAVSRWCVLDLHSKRICKCADFLPFSDEDYTDKCAIEPHLTRANLGIADGQPVARTQMLNVRNCDLDYNRHMNNARYGDIIFNVCDLDQLCRHTITAFDIHFICELFADESFCVERIDCDNGKTSLFRATKTQSNKLAFSAKIGWV